MSRIAAAQFLPHFRIRALPETLQILRRLHRPAVGREQMEGDRRLARDRSAASRPGRTAPAASPTPRRCRRRRYRSASRGRWAPSGDRARCRAAAAERPTAAASSVSDDVLSRAPAAAAGNELRRDRCRAPAKCRRRNQPRGCASSGPRSSHASASSRAPSISSSGATGCSRKHELVVPVDCTRLDRAADRVDARARRSIASASAIPVRCAMATRTIASVVAESGPAVTSSAISHSASCTPLSRPITAPCPVASVTCRLCRWTRAAWRRDPDSRPAGRAATRFRRCDRDDACPSSVAAMRAEGVRRPVADAAACRGQRSRIGSRSDVVGRRRPSSRVGSDSHAHARAALERAAGFDQDARQPRMQRQALHLPAELR